MHRSGPRFAHALCTAALATACSQDPAGTDTQATSTVTEASGTGTATDNTTTGTTGTTGTDPTTAGPTTGSTTNPDPTTAGPTTDDPTTGDPTTAGPTTDSTTDTTTDDPETTGTSTTGGLPEGYLADNERYPADMFILDGEIYWTNHIGAGCVRKVALAGGTPTTVACEATNQTFPLLAVPYDGKIAWTYMSTGGGPQTLGFGGVRMVDAPGNPPQTINEGSRFKSSSSGAICNDSLVASGNQLYWFTHLLGGYNEGKIVRYSNGQTHVFPAGSDFPYGVITTPTSIQWSASEAWNKNPLNAIENQPGMTIGMTVGSSCGRTAVGETIYIASRGTFALKPALFRTQGALVEKLRDLNEVAYDLAVDDTHLYLAFESTVDRLPLANLAGAPLETVVYAPSYVGGILTDDDNLYWTEYEDGGAVRVLPKP